jgi:hypothetical protein
MTPTVNVLVIEDNECCNNLIFNSLQKSIHYIQKTLKYKLVFHSFTDSYDCINKIETLKFTDNNVIAFVDNKFENGVSGSQIIKLLKKVNSNTLAILLASSKKTENPNLSNDYDFYVIKDMFAPALCRLYLDQYIENKFS